MVMAVEAQSSGGNNGNPVAEVADNIRIPFLPSRVIDFARGWRGRRLRWWRDGIPKKGGQKIKVSGRPKKTRRERRSGENSCLAWLTAVLSFDWVGKAQLSVRNPEFWPNRTAKDDNNKKGSRAVRLPRSTLRSLTIEFWSSRSGSYVTPCLKRLSCAQFLYTSLFGCDR